MYIYKFRGKNKPELLRSTQPIDVAAHLALLGESLGIIGQRLKEHQVRSFLFYFLFFSVHFYVFVFRAK